MKRKYYKVVVLKNSVATLLWTIQQLNKVVKLFPSAKNYD